MGWYDRRLRRVRDLSSAGFRIVLELEVRRIECGACASVKRERLEFLADNPHFTKRFAFYVGRRCRQAAIRDVAKELKLDWETVKTLEMQYMRAQIERAGAPTRSRFARATSIASWSAIWCARGRSGSAAKTVPRRAWRSSTLGWGHGSAAKSGSS